MLATRWDGMLQETARHAELASKTGTRFLRLFGGAIPTGMSRDDARALAIGHLRQVVEICKRMGCKPLLETHDAWTVSSAVLEIISGFSQSEVGVLWDLEHPGDQVKRPLIPHPPSRAGSITSTSKTRFAQRVNQRQCCLATENCRWQNA